MSNLYTLFATPEDRDLSRAAAERHQLLQAVREHSGPSRSSVPNPRRFLRTRTVIEVLRPQQVS